MTELEWLAGTDPRSMLEFLRGTVSERKTRLFLCACCRTFWTLLVDDRSRKAVEVAEAYADGLVAKKALDAAWRGAWDAYRGLIRGRAGESESVWVAGDEQRLFAHTASDLSFSRFTNDPSLFHEKFFGADDENYEPPPREFGNALCVAEVNIVHDLVGNPFHTISVDPSWLTSTAVTLAQAVYDERATDRLPILADALEEAGCTNADILGHCRSSSLHVHGCWVMDLLLSKE
jgi:hypothetical protein